MFIFNVSTSNVLLAYRKYFRLFAEDWGIGTFFELALMGVEKKRKKKTEIRQQMFFRPFFFFTPIM